MIASKKSKVILVLGTIIIASVGLWAFKPNAKNSASTKQINIVKEAAKQVTVYKSQNCGCCIKWNDYLRNAQYKVTAYNTDKLAEYKVSVGVPMRLQSCHTAMIGGYVVEGHVPLREIERLLTERPDAVGLSVPGMASGSPGMENGRFDTYDVILFRKDGSTEIYASY